MTTSTLFSIALQEKLPVDLHHKFVKLFYERRMITNKMMALLPQIEKSEIYTKYGCENIFEYAFRFGKFSRALTSKALRTWESTEDKPHLRELIVEHGIHKVAMVVNLATPKTEKIFAEHVANMSKPALQEFVKELRQSQSMMNENLGDKHKFAVSGCGKVDCTTIEGDQLYENSLNPDPKSENFENSRKCHCARTKMTIELDNEMQIIFNQLKHKYARNCSHKQALKILLEKLAEFSKSTEKVKREEVDAMTLKVLEKSNLATISQKQDVPGDVLQLSNGLKNYEAKAKLVLKSENSKSASKSAKIQKPSGALRPHVLGKLQSRYIPIEIRRSTIASTGGKCAYPNCTKTIENFHHRIPFAAQIDNRSIVGLCKIHHEFAHNGVIRHELSEPEKWTLNLEAKRSMFDQAYFLKKNVK